MIEQPSETQEFGALPATLRPVQQKPSTGSDRLSAKDASESVVPGTSGEKTGWVAFIDPREHRITVALVPRQAIRHRQLDGGVGDHERQAAGLGDGPLGVTPQPQVTGTSPGSVSTGLLRSCWLVSWMPNGGGGAGLVVRHGASGTARWLTMRESRNGIRRRE